MARCPCCWPSLNHKELAIAWRDGAPFWEEFKASFIYTEGGELAKKYFARVASFIDGNLASGNAELFLGQIALACSLNELSAGRADGRWPGARWRECPMPVIQKMPLAGPLFRIPFTVTNGSSIKPRCARSIARWLSEKT
ncbi:Uncharacterised protein [Cedecea neteri]|uniref:Uncharacterized protein n=1 Tax=Cedecea neteri TaxID=158822 RepID=A0A2X3IEU5_9ENTR|nr:Uncharacterised protein [Cedecea neteri]